MNDYQESSSPVSDSSLFIKMVVSNWELQNTRVNGLLEKLTDEQLYANVAPGRNRGIYLLGHLTAVSDGMLPLFGLGDKLYPEMESDFLRNPDSTEKEYPSVEELRSRWNQVNARLSAHFESIEPSEWFQKHASISAEDFAKEPHRNKLNILINRTIHQSYHLGQLIFLK